MLEYLTPCSTRLGDEKVRVEDVENATSEIENVVVKNKDTKMRGMWVLIGKRTINKLELESAFIYSGSRGEARQVGQRRAAGCPSAAFVLQHCHLAIPPIPVLLNLGGWPEQQGRGQALSKQFNLYL